MGTMVENLQCETLPSLVHIITHGSNALENVIEFNRGPNGF